MYSRVPPFWGSTSCWRGVSFTTQCLLNVTKASPYSPMNLTTKAQFTFHYLQSRGTHPQLNWRLSRSPQSWGTHPQLNWRLPRTPQPSRVKDPRVTSPQTFTSMNPRGESKPMQPMQMARDKCSNPSLSNSNKATNAYGGIREEEQRRNTKNSKIQIYQVPLTQK